MSEDILDQYILIADILLILLLATILIFGWRILKSLKNFSAAKADMQKLITDMSKQIGNAQAAVKELKENAQGTGKELERQIDRAQNMSNELEFIYDAAVKVADKLGNVTEGTTKPKKSVKKNKKKEEKMIVAL